MGLCILKVGWLFLMLAWLTPERVAIGHEFVPEVQQIQMTSIPLVQEVQGLPWEIRLRRFSFSLLKSVRRFAIRLVRLVRRTAGSWTRWVVVSSVLLFVGALASAVDRRLLTIWRQQGWRIAYSYAAIGMAVFFRLLRERRVPRGPRLAILVALIYGVIPRDLLTDHAIVIGWVEDVLFIALAARWFTRRCPDDVVQAHAAYVRRRTARMLPTS